MKNGLQKGETWPCQKLNWHLFVYFCVEVYSVVEAFQQRVESYKLWTTEVFSSVLAIYMYGNFMPYFDTNIRKNTK